MAADVMSARELAEFLGLNEDTIYKKVRRGEIPALHVGRSLRFHRPTIVEWLRGQMRQEAVSAPAISPDSDSRFTVTTCGGLRRSSSRSAFYHGR